ncbi:lanthionine synthetase LanC family protein [Elizabethkingia miricola]|uniref:lanthionine synthetase LanC family protein n=1 Tax=Elizabethkingia miricola TaxID=172045 RepID=UPI003891E95D
MTTNKELNELETGLNEISEFLLSKIKRGQNGFYWDTISYDHNVGEFSFAFNPSLWNGTGGIAWFFLVLYESTGKTDYLEIAEKSFSKIYHFSINHNIAGASLYDGICGTIYFSLELFRVTGKNLYLKQASELYDRYREKILAEQTEDMLIGISGILIVLTLLYHFTKSNSIYHDITVLVTNLLKKSLVAEAGIKWGSNQLSVDSLCGFSHGNSGIGFSLLQLGKYFNNQEFIWLAEQAFLYESLYYNPEKNNWMDLRWENSKNDLPNLFDWTKETFLPEDFDLNTWAHGACGIGTARVAAFKITAGSVYKKDCIKAFERCKRDIVTRSKRNHILFSGYGGLADFLIQYHNTFGDKESMELATEIVQEGLEKSRQTGHSEWGIQNSEDLGLMTGTTGIAFSLLMITKGKTFNSILHPELPDSDISVTNNNTLKNIKIKETFFRTYYPQTIEILETIIQPRDAIYDSQNLDDFSNSLLNLIEYLPQKDIMYVSDIYLLETAKIQFLKKHKGTLCFQTRLIMLQNDLNQILGNNEVDFSERLFIRNPFIHIHESQLNWKESNNRESGVGVCYNVFYSTDKETFHFIIDPFSAIILKLLEKPLSIEELANQFQYSHEEKEIVARKLTDQIKELLKSFFIRIR